MYTLIGIKSDDNGTWVHVCGTFDELDDARRLMASEWSDGMKAEREWSDDPDSVDGELGDRSAWIAGGDLYHESRWVILDPIHNPIDRI